MGVLEVLLIIFIVLKAVGVLQWGWMAILTPLWIELFLIWVAVLLNT